MKYYNAIEMTEHPGKLIFSVACGWIYGLTSYGHVWQHLGLHIWQFTNLTQNLNDAVQYLISLVKAVSFGGASYVGATAMGKLGKWWKKKYKK